MTYSIEVKKTGSSKQVDFDKFNQDVKDYIISYGLTQILNDAHSQYGSNPDRKNYTPDFEVLSNAAVDAKLEGMYNGVVRNNAAPGLNYAGKESGLMFKRCAELSQHKVKDLRAHARKKNITAEALLIAIAKQVGLDGAEEVAKVKQALQIPVAEIDLSSL